MSHYTTTAGNPHTAASRVKRVEWTVGSEIGTQVWTASRTTTPGLWNVKVEETLDGAPTQVFHPEPMHVHEVQDRSGQDVCASSCCCTCH